MIFTRLEFSFQGKISKGFPCLNKKMKKSVCACYGPHAEVDRGSKIQKIYLSFQVEEGALQTWRSHFWE